MFEVNDQPSTERYKRDAQLGRGGMGVVHRAYDHKLDRWVALKQVRDDGEPELREWLLKEARVMAQLAHPNVVQVFEIVDEGETAFIVMEYVEGVTLRQWAAAVSRSVEEVIAVLSAAGEGLAAAHDKGLVHRDFKPDNVMVGDDRRVRVMDFGLALPDPESDETILFGSGQSGDVRRRPALAGTPAYMAPELCHNRWPDAASDQFSYCVTFYELLYGKRPFAGSTPDELWAAMGRSEVRELPADTRVPAWLHDVILRGLQPDPRDRFNSMHELLDELAVGELDVGEPEDHEVARERAAVVIPGPLGWVLLVASFLIVGGLGFSMEVGQRDSEAGPEPEPGELESKPGPREPADLDGTPPSAEEGPWDICVSEQVDKLQAYTNRGELLEVALSQRQDEGWWCGRGPDVAASPWVRAVRSGDILLAVRPPRSAGIPSEFRTLEPTIDVCVTGTPKWPQEAEAVSCDPSACSREQSCYEVAAAWAWPDSTVTPSLQLDGCQERLDPSGPPLELDCPKIDARSGCPRLPKREVSDRVINYRRTMGLKTVRGKTLDDICNSYSGTVTVQVLEDCTVEVKEFDSLEIRNSTRDRDCCHQQLLKNVKCK